MPAVLRGRSIRGVVTTALVAALVLAAAGCGFSESTSGGRGKTIKWYVFNEPGGAFEQAIATCNKQAGGKYTIQYVRLPTDADQQRELVVRRLAAKDSDIDIIGMDVIWTAEFAEAGWIKPWTGARAQRALNGKLKGPQLTAQYKNTLWADPFTSNTQFLFYRKDRVPKPPPDFTWDQMIDQASQRGKAIEVQAARYEGYTVWINSLIASAGGSIVDENGNVKVDQTAARAAQIIKKLATSKAAPPGMSNNKEDDARLGFESGRSDYQTNYSFIYASAAKIKGFQPKIGVAPWPRVDASKPPRVTLGGINLGIGAYSKNPELSFQAAECLAQPENQVVASEKGGLAPSTGVLFSNPRVKKVLPFADIMSTQIENGVPRPVTPAYSDISQAIQKTFHPPDGVDPSKVVSDLRDKLKKAAEGKIF
ncbi:MAG: trehalose/maltose transport system substrate-binding protein [Thermoleophilaceae bacterium]|nr:trehalose/maltose transport system substrate-binding protein [Thermoleophilaceae bacterium]